MRQFEVSRRCFIDASAAARSLATDSTGERRGAPSALSSPPQLRTPELNPMQAAFFARDGLQCGYCAPGQIRGPR